MAKNLLDLLDGMAPAVQEAFLQVIADKKSDVQLATLIKAIRASDTEAVVRILALGQEYFMPLDAMLREAQTAGAGFALEEFKRKAKRAGLNAVARFDGRNLRAESFLRNQSSKLITRISTDTRDITRDILRAAMEQGRGPKSVALDLVGRYDRLAGRRVGGIIGMTPGDVEASKRALEQLRSGDPKELRKYLRRGLRNKSYDQMVIRAIKDKKPVPADMARKIVARYEDKLLFSRGETIARTELLQSLHASQDEAFQQLYDDGKLTPDQVTSTWDAAQDADTRASHRFMDDQVQATDGTFTTGAGYRMRYPGDSSLGAPASEIVNCRCRVRKNIDFIKGLKPGD
ncbi:MAG: hypothetical protein JKY94_11645 [Rhodobacteraceae bacterium]|nr:hypothetical protein [Paracoccaceae bacterium]